MMCAPKQGLAARACGLGLLLLVVAAPIGCQSKATGVVKGKVTFANKPLGIGTVAFFAADNRHASGAIQRDGTYTINDAPVGDVKIVITVPSRSSMMMMGRGGPPKPPKDMKMPSEMLPPGYTGPEGPGEYVPISERYAKLETTDLTYTVTKGEQTHDIPLKP
jgi:hypothetical protein